MMLDYFEKIVERLEAKIAAPGGATARRLFALELGRLGVRLYSGEHQVAWCGVIVPFDVLNAMDVTSCFVEFVGASLAASGAVGSFLDQGEQAGLATDICSYHRSVIGAAASGLMPVPSVFIGTSCPCSAGQSTIENLARMMKREMMMLHVPQESTPEAVRYLTEQLAAMIDFVEARADRQLAPEKLAAAIELSNATAALMAEVYDLAAHVPSPVRSRDLKDFGLVMPLLFGREEGLLLATAYRDELRRRLDDGASSPERVRLLWIQNRIQFREPLLRMLEEEHGATIVIDEPNNVTWDPIDPRDPLPGIARRMIGNMFNGPIERRVGKMVDLARRYRVHGAVNPCNWGCRQGAGARGLIQAGLAEVGVPVLNLEVDCVDPRAFAEGQLRTRFEAFVEMIESRPSSWS